MGKIRTAFSLLASGSLAQFFRHLQIALRRRQLRRTGQRPLVYRLPGFQFVCLPGVPDSAETFLTRATDRFELELLRHWLAPGDTFIDAGANLGLYTFCACEQLKNDGIIVAIEASPDLAPNLEAAAQLLGVRNLLVEQVALGNEAKEITFYVAAPGASTAEQSLRPDPARASDYIPRAVRMTTLTEIIARHPAATYPAAVKLDIEGAEPLALRGTPPDWLGAGGPLWFVEINPGALAHFNTAPSDIISHFPKNAYTCWLHPQYPVATGRDLPLRPLTADETFSDALYYNLIAVPKGPGFAARRQRLARLSLLPDSLAR